MLLSLVIAYFIVLWPQSCGIGYAKRLTFYESFRVLVTLFFWRIPMLLVKEKRPKLFGLCCGSSVLGNMAGRNLLIFEGQNVGQSLSSSFALCFTF